MAEGNYAERCDGITYINYGGVCMFNKEMKERFIKETTGSHHTENVARIMFDAIEPYEMNIWKADFCTVDLQKLQPVMDKILGLRMSSKWMAVTLLKKYVVWCLDKEKYPSACDAIMSVKYEGLGKVREQMTANPIHLQAYFDKVFTLESEETLDNIYRCFLWMAYAGMNEDDALKVEIKDVNLTELRVEYEGVAYPIYREAIPAFKNAIHLTSFVYKHPNYPEKIVMKKRAPGNTIIRGINFNSEEGKTRQDIIYTLRSQLSRRLSEASKNKLDKKTNTMRDKLTEQTLSYYRIWLSGIFYRASEAERAGIPVQFADVADELMDRRVNIEKKEYKYGAKQGKIQKRNRKARDYMEDYRRWKLAFSI
jgi:hypothetical protein